MSLKQYLGFKLGVAPACALWAALSACSDDGTTGAPSTSQNRPDAASDARAENDASTDDAAWDTDAAVEDARAEAATEAAIADGDGGDAEPDAGDAELDAADAATDAAPRCATLDCDDAIDCTVDDCDEAVGCTHTASNALCDDKKACTGAETCNATTGCEPGTPIVCGDSDRCTFDYCVEPAGECAHRDVSTSVELLVNGHFDYGANVAWRLDPINLSPSQIHKNAQLAHTGAWYVWLGAFPGHMRLWQDVEVPATASELTLSGVYEVTPGQGAPALSSYFRIDIEDTLTGATYERALSRGSTQTNAQWVPFTFTTREPHAGKVLKIEISSYNAPDDLTHFKADTVSLRAKICPAE
jgi:hypothetical protein